MVGLSDKKLYSPLNYNSNTAVDLALCAAGLNLPQDDGIWDNWAPASLNDTDCNPLPLNMPLDIYGNDSSGPDMGGRKIRSVQLSSIWTATVWKPALYRPKYILTMTEISLRKIPAGWAQMMACWCWTRR